MKIYCLTRNLNMLPVRCLGRSRKPLSAIVTCGSRSKSTSSPQHERRQVVDSSNVVHSPYPEITIPNLNLSEFVWRKADRWKHWPALTDAVTGKSFTYGEARAASERLAISLPDLSGLKPGDTLALVMPNCPEFALTLLGATSAGLVVTPVNPVYTSEELSRQLSDSGARAVVTTLELLEKVQEALEHVAGGAQVLVATDGSGTQEDHLTRTHPSLLSVHKLLRTEYTRRTPRLPRADPESLAILPYSSGTTGLPKGVRLTHKNLVANLCQMEHPEIMSHAPDGCQDVSLNVLPFFHIYGLNGTMNVGMSLGRHLVTIPRFDASLFAEALTRYKPTVLSVVPPLVLFLSNTNLVSASDLSRVRFITCGAAPATPALIEKFIEKANNSNLDFREGYGMTETSCMALFTPIWSGLSKLGSCGAPVPHTEIKIVDESGEALPLGHEGELLVRGPQVMQGYHKNDEATRETFTQDGWLKTGDIAYVDEEGLVFLVDRKKELIKVKGLQVSPTELEGVLRKMEGIADVAVIGVPDERAGELPRAFVVRSPNSTISESSVAAFIEDKVAPFKRLAGGVRFVQEIPKNAAGKTLRKVLKEM